MAQNVYFAMNFLFSMLKKLLKSLADAVNEKGAGQHQVRDQGGGDQNHAGHVLGIGLAKFDEAPDVSVLSIPYIYEREFGFDEPVLFEVDTKDEIIAMVTAMGTAWPSVPGLCNLNDIMVLLSHFSGPLQR